MVVKFSDLSFPLKILTVLCWIVVSLNLLGFAVAFLEGFIQGYTGVN